MKKYLTLSEYEIIAKKIINASFPKLSNWIMSDNDKFGEVVTALILGDMHWDGRGTLVGYRKQRVQWCIQTIINKEKKRPVSLNINITDNMELLETIPDVIGPDMVEYNDKLEVLRSRVRHSSVLTDREKTCMTQYFDNKSLDNIGEELGISKECIKTTIRRGLKKMGKIE